MDRRSQHHFLSTETNLNEFKVNEGLIQKTEEGSYHKYFHSTWTHWAYTFLYICAAGACLATLMFGGDSTSKEKKKDGKYMVLKIGLTMAFALAALHHFLMRDDTFGIILICGYYCLLTLSLLMFVNL
jgi:hypothetical protein